MIYIRVFSASRNAERNLARNPDFQILNPETGPKPGNVGRLGKPWPFAEPYKSQSKNPIQKF